MTDSVRKNNTIRHIQKLQLSQNLIFALDDRIQAEEVADAVEQLIQLNHHWH